MLNLIVIMLIWWVVGVAGFIFWWSKDWELEKSDLIFGIFIGLMGPLTWVAGWFLHGTGYNKIKNIFK